MRKNKITILFICPYPTGQAPSQRFRFEQYFEILHQNKFAFDIRPFITSQTWEVLYRRGHVIQKVAGLSYGYLKRFFLLPAILKYEFIFIHREAAPFGPPLFEWIVAKMFRKKIIYDFDDAIWLTDKSRESVLERTLRFRNKVASICKWSYKVSCGNSYLVDYAKQFNKNVFFNPTTIDTINYHNPQLFEKTKLKTQLGLSGIVVGWTGSNSTLKYLENLQSVLQRFENTDTKIYFLVIADRPPTLNFNNLIYKKWTAATEISDLLLADIGIMPLPDDEWTKGKCGFKILQYMALSIPSVASAVGVNSQIVQQGINGYLCSTEDDWVTQLTTLINDATLRQRIGEKGRNTVIQHYSTASNSENFLRLFE